MKANRVTVFAALFCMPWLATAEVNATEINQIAADWQKVCGAPGSAVGIVQDAKLIYSQGFGVMSLATQQKPDKRTSFLIGSLTKQFAAGGIILLKREGKVKLDDTITKYIPSAPSSWSDITLNHLLHHTSGLFNYTDIAVSMISPKPFTLSDVIKVTSGQKRKTKPGEAFEYCNTGYYLLGSVIEAVTKKPYFDYLNTKIFKPLGMSRTYIYRRSIPRPYEAIGYSDAPNRFLPPNEVTPGAAGNLASTVEDLAKWDAALQGNDLFTKEEKALMWTPYTLNSGAKSDYGMGWRVGNEGDLPVVEHGGGIPGFTTYIKRFLNEKTTIIVLKNSMNGSSPSDLVTQISLRIIPKLAKLSEGIPDDNTQLTARTLNFARFLIANNPDRSQMSDEANKGLTPQLVRQVSEQFEPYGPLSKLTLLKRESTNGTVISTYLATFPTVSLKLMVSVNSEGKFAGIRFLPFP